MVEEGSDSQLFKIADQDKVMMPVFADDEARAEEEVRVKNFTVYGRKKNNHDK